MALPSASLLPGNPQALRPAGHQRALYATILIGAILVTFLPPALSIAAVVGVAALLFFLSRPGVGFYALLFCVPFESVRNIQLGGLNVTITEFAVFCISMAWLSRGIAEGRIEPGIGPWRGPLLIYGAVLIASISQSADLVSSIKELLKWGELLFAYLVGMTLVRTRQDIRRLLIVMFGAALVESLVGVGQAVLHSGPSSFARGAFLRASGTFDQPNPFAGYLNMILPFAVVLLAYRIFPQRLMWIVVAVLGGGVLTSLSRGGQLATLVWLAVIACLVSHSARVIVGALVVSLFGLIGCALAGVIPTGLTDPLNQAFLGGNVDVVNPSPETWAVAERLAHMEAGLKMWADHPLLGVGVGNYPTRYPEYQVADVWAAALGHAHNYYINIGAEAGVIGLLAFLLLIGSAITIGVRAFRRADDRLSRALALGGTGVMVGISVHSFFDDVFVHGMEVQMAIAMVIVSRVAIGFVPDADQPLDAVASHAAATE